ncbi:MAG: DNA translocase FtsK 4TM domain-containing protein, partial [Actinomycetes bacterium]
MARRASASATRTRSGTGSTSRNATTKASGKTRTAASKSRTTSSRPRTTSTARTRKTARAAPTLADVIPSPFTVLYRLVRALWLGTAHLVGRALRGIGRGARDLDPALRRDGVGFGLLGVALVVAAGEWWALPGPVGHSVHAVVAGTLGVVGLVTPVLLVFLGARLLRHPERSAATGPVLIGLAALLVGSAALAHVVHEVPTPSDGALDMREGGGVVGYVISAPLVTALTSYVATPILGLLLLFGLLVVTGTPVHAIPERVRGARDRALGRAPVPAEGDEADASSGARRPRRRPAADGT